MLSPRARRSPSMEMLWPWTEAEAMLETIVVWHSVRTSLSKDSTKSQAKVTLYNKALHFSRFR
jgi:hypothetical protein